MQQRPCGCESHLAASSLAFMGNTPPSINADDGTCRAKMKQGGQQQPHKAVRNFISHRGQRGAGWPRVHPTNPLHLQPCNTHDRSSSALRLGQREAPTPRPPLPETTDSSPWGRCLEPASVLSCPCLASTSQQTRNIWGARRQEHIAAAGLPCVVCVCQLPPRKDHYFVAWTRCTTRRSVYALGRLNLHPLC